MGDDTEPLKALAQLINVMKNIFAIYKSVAGSESVGLRKVVDTIANYETYTMKNRQLPFKAHAPLFTDVYKENRQSFLNMIDEPDFLSTRKISIWFGKDNQAARSKKMILPINIAFEKAKLLYEPLEEQIKKDKYGDSIVDEHNSRIMEKPEYTMYFELQYALLDVIYHALIEVELTADLKQIRRCLKQYQEIIFLNEDGEVEGSTFASVLKNATERVSKLTGKNVNLNLGDLDKNMQNAEAMLADGEVTQVATDFIGDITSGTSKPGQSITELIIEKLQVHGPKLEQAFGGMKEPRPEGVTTEGHEEEPTQPKIEEDEIEFV